MYEGYEWDVNDCSTSPSDLDNCFLNHLTKEVDDIGISDEGTRESEECSRGSVGFPYYDRDTSNSSDFPSSSHEEVNQASHQRGFGEAAARGAKAASSFYPVSEETVFMDPPSSPHSPDSASIPMDTWMLYNSDCSYLQMNESSEDVSSDFYHATGATVKRIRQHSQCDEDCEEEEEDEEEDDSEFSSSSKRVKKNSVELQAKKKATFTKRMMHQKDLPKNAESAQVDIRMIDFANVTFSNRAGGSSASNATVHHGPDCGFLTGVDSLKRLLTEILSEG